MASDDHKSHRSSSSSHHSHSHSSSSTYCDGDDIVHVRRRHSSGRHKSSGGGISTTGAIETAGIVKTFTRFAIIFAIVAVLGSISFSLARTNVSQARDLKSINAQNNVLLENERTLKAEIEELKAKCEELNSENNKLVEKLNALKTQ